MRLKCVGNYIKFIADDKKPKTNTSVAGILASMKVTTQTKLSDETFGPALQPKLNLARPPPKTRAAKIEAGLQTDKPNEKEKLEKMYC